MGSRFLWRMAVLSAALTAVTCAFRGHTTYECSSDSDCPDNMSCNGETCDPGACATASDCPGAHSWCPGPHGKCWTGCRDNSECAIGFECQDAAYSAPHRFCITGISWIAVDEETVYYVLATENGAVMRVPRDGGTPTVLASGQHSPWGLTVDATSVYWTTSGNLSDAQSDGGQSFTSGSVMKVARTGGAPTTLVSSIPYGFVEIGWSPPMVAVDDTSVYWTNVGFEDPTAQFTPTGSVTKVPLGGGSPVALAPRQTAPAAIAVDGTNAYWMTLAPSNGNGAVMKVGRDGGTPVALATPDQSAFSAIVVAGGSVYWTNSTAIMRVSTTGGTPELVASVDSAPVAVAADAENIYWQTGGTIRNPDAGSTAGAIEKAPLAGGARTRLATSNVIVFGPLFGPSSNITVDSTSVYWVEGWSIMKIGKNGGSPTVVVTMSPPSWAAP